MTTRRDFLKVTGGVVVGALTPGWGRRRPKAMSVVRESSFIKPFDDYSRRPCCPSTRR